jgi:5-methyltetrahydropteroyltriglutamate--homocysteine methyltransferase
MTHTHLLGYPRIGEQRELKNATELYWKGDISRDELEQIGRDLRKHHWQKQAAAGIDLVPCNDFSFYDQVLDLSCLVGNIPERFGWDGGMTTLKTQFIIARGASDSCCGNAQPGFASEMTKWFDTNYHYIVPEFKADTQFKLSSTKIFDEFLEASALGLRAKPVIIGPVTYLTLGKVHDRDHPEFDRFSLLDRLLPVYEEILIRLGKLGAEWIQVDEPVLALDLSPEQKAALRVSHERLAHLNDAPKILVATYFGELRENLPLFTSLPVDGLHYDAVRGSQEFPKLLDVFPKDKVLSLGIVDGRNIWKNDYTASMVILESAANQIGPDRLWLSSSCSLLHSPVSLKAESGLNDELRDWLAFADEKVTEICTLRDLLRGSAPSAILASNQASHQQRQQSTLIHNPKVKARLSFVLPEDSQRKSTFVIRQKLQREKLGLPLFPTTTIGSFPQTREVRAARARWKKGLLSQDDYETFLREETRSCLELQEEIGIDVLVHGEFERNDMVEYFGEQLEGFAFTTNGWVQSYGTRCVKPPIIFGDVRRSKPMTVEWAKYAQSLTHKPVKGMLTGPITILQWSFVRDDQPRETTARQIAMAIRDEVSDLEKAKISVIQIDEPAIREGLPLRRSDWNDYLKWAVDAFKLSSCGVGDETQIHTHMCYSEFNDILHSIAALDADVITIETSRSNMELLDAFSQFAYPNEIGPGVYDIHSPRVPMVSEMAHLLRKAAQRIPLENLWVNPDCGLKTRGWEETKAALIHMVAAARELRQEHAPTSAPLTEDVPA